MTFALRSKTGLVPNGPSSFPAGVTPGDLLVGFTATDGNGQTFTTPNPGGTQPWVRLGTAVNATSVCVIARFYQAGDTVPPFVWSGGNVEADIAAFSGGTYTDLATIVDQYSDRASTSTTLIVLNGGSLAPTKDNGLAIMGGRIRKTSVSDAATFSAMPTGFTKLSSANPNGNNQATVWMYSIQGAKATIALQQTVAMNVPESAGQNTQGLGMVLFVGTAVPSGAVALAGGNPNVIRALNSVLTPVTA